MGVTAGSALLASWASAPSSAPVPSYSFANNPDLVWDQIASSPSHAGLWRCATYQSRSSLGSGELRVTWGETDLTFAYVSPDASSAYPPALSQSALLTNDGRANVYAASLGPIVVDGTADDTPYINGVCLIRAQPGGPRIGLVSYDDGGNWCCNVYRLLIPTPNGMLKAVDDEQELPAGQFLTFGRLTDADGRLVISTENGSFLGPFTGDIADSSLPVLLLAFHDDQLIDVTKEHPKIVEDDARAQWEAGLHPHNASKDSRGLLAAWMADQCVLQRGQAAWSTMIRLERKGIFSNGWNGAPKGTAYLAEVGSFLHSQGECLTNPLQVPATAK